MGYPTVQLCTVLDISVYIISEVKLIFKVLGYSMGNFRLARPIRVNDVEYYILVIGFSNSGSTFFRLLHQYILFKKGYLIIW
jgi:hypothetical protein